MAVKDKALVFDFGNVLIDLDYDKHFTALSSIFGNRWPARDYPPQIHLAIYKYDKGLISDDSFIWQFQQFNLEVDPRKIVQAWNDMISEMDIKVFSMLEQLKSDYRLYILSNINSLHFRCIHSYLKRTFDISNFENQFFDHCFYSYQIQKRKPEMEVYKHVQESLKCDGPNILFVDDKAENVETAINAGWNSICHNPKDRIWDKIEDYISKAGL